MSGIFVKYIVSPDAVGYKPGPLGIHWPGRPAPLDFPVRDDLGTPAPIRAEEFVTEEDAERFVRRYDRGLFVIDRALIAARDRDVLQRMIDATVAPLAQRIADLEAAGSLKKRPARPKGAEE